MSTSLDCPSEPYQKRQHLTTMHGPADILGHLDQMVGQSRGTMIERSAAQVPQRRYRSTPTAQQKALPLFERDKCVSRKPESVPAATPWAGISCPQGRKLDRLAAPVCLPNRHQPSPHSAIDAHWLRTAARQQCVWKLHAMLGCAYRADFRTMAIAHGS